MIYLNANHLAELGINWNAIIQVLENATESLDQNDFAQPIKPYLRYGNPSNRIIAMPAYVGGAINLAGIKWIASFPNNIQQNKLRANSITVLNEAETGIPISIINTSLVSGIRTAGVTGLIIKKYLASAPGKTACKIGITGFGPIGNLHLQMLNTIVGDTVSLYKIFDPKGINTQLIPVLIREKTEVVQSWEAAYEDADIFVTCTVSPRPYINKPPKKGSLQMNVSLRDYEPTIQEHVKYMIVDSWEEVCRENTDIESMHKKNGLQKVDTLSLTDVVCHNKLTGITEKDVLMFNPMGMAIFDIAVGRHYYDLAKQQQVGTLLEM